MIRFGRFASSKFGDIRSVLVPNRRFCDKISDKNSYNSVISEIKQSIHKLESEIEQQNKLRNRQSEKQFEEMVANFDELQNIYGKFENKLALSMKEMEGGKKEMKKTFDKFGCNLRIERKKMQEEPEMKEAKIKQSLHKLESEIEQQNKIRIRQSEKEFENKLALSIKEVEEEYKKMKEAFDKFYCNLGIERKKMDKEQQKSGMEEAKAANLTEQIEGNVNFIAMKNNKWDSEDCEPDLKIFGGGLKVKHTGRYNEFKCVCATLPLPKFNLNGKSIIGYFEVEILKIKKHPMSTFQLGLCSKQYPFFYALLGDDSIVILDKNEIYIEGSAVEFEENDHKYKYDYYENDYEDEEDNDFNKGDVIGLGIINSQTNEPMKCFATCNGKLLGMAKLPAKFAEIPLFPAVGLFYAGGWFFSGDSIKANFGANEWRFNPSQLLE